MPATLIRKIALGAIVALLAALLGSAIAVAAAHFDPSNGGGFVSRSDIYGLFKVAPKVGLTFTYTRTLLLSQECVRQTGSSMIEYQTRKSSLAYEQPLDHSLRLRRRGQLSGYYLEGYASPSRRVPALPANLCPNASDNGRGSASAATKWEPTGPVQIVGAAPGQLRASYQGVTRALIYTNGEE